MWLETCGSLPKSTQGALTQSQGGGRCDNDPNVVSGVGHLCRERLQGKGRRSIQSTDQGQRGSNSLCVRNELQGKWSLTPWPEDSSHWRCDVHIQTDGSGDQSSIALTSPSCSDLLFPTQQLGNELSSRLDISTKKDVLISKFFGYYAATFKILNKWTFSCSGLCIVLLCFGWHDAVLSQISKVDLKREDETLNQGKYIEDRLRKKPDLLLTAVDEMSVFL